MKVKSCRLCLAVEVKVFKLGNTEVKQLFETVFKQNGLHNPLYESHYICYMCKALMNKLNNFIQRVVIAQKMLSNMLADKKKITLLTVKEIHAEQNDFTNDLVIEVLKNINIYSKTKEDEEITEIKVEKIEPSGAELILNEDHTSDSECPFNVNETIDEQKLVANYVKENPPSSMKLHKSFVEKVKNRKRNSRDTRNITKPPKKTKALLPSKFILSLESVGNRKERRKNNQYKFEDSDSEITETEKKIDENDQVYEEESTQESSDSDYDMYDDSGRKNLKPQREYPRKCDHCESEIPKGVLHRIHYMIEHPKIPYPYAQVKMRFVCHICGKIQNKKHTHVSHLLTHNDEKLFKCQKCPKSFHNKIRLRSHVIGTHPKKFLECDFCSKLFKRKADIKRHIRIHTGEKPYKCHICGAGFAHKGNIGSHVRLNHEQSDINSKSKRNRKRT